jgi:hypothetical protein
VLKINLPLSLSSSTSILGSVYFKWYIDQYVKCSHIIQLGSQRQKCQCSVTIAIYLSWVIFSCQKWVDMKIQGRMLEWKTWNYGCSRDLTKQYSTSIIYVGFYFCGLLTHPQIFLIAKRCTFISHPKVLNRSKPQFESRTFQYSSAQVSTETWRTAIIQYWGV